MNHINMTKKPLPLTAHKPKGVIFVASCTSFRKNFILAKTIQLVSPQCSFSRETLAAIVPHTQKSNVRKFTFTN